MDFSSTLRKEKKTRVPTLPDDQLTFFLNITIQIILSNHDQLLNQVGTNFPNATSPPLGNQNIEILF